MTPNKITVAPQRVGILLVLCSWLFFTNGVFGDEQPAVVQLGDGVVVDISGQLIYTMHPKAGIHAINASTGDSVWKSTSADRPVSVSDAVLLAQVEAKKPGLLELAYLDATTGQSLKALNVAIPDDTRARVTDSMDSRFSVQVISGEKPELLYWKNSFKKVRGAQLSRNEAPAQRIAGFLAADFSRRTVEKVSQPSKFKDTFNYRAPMPANAPGKRALYSQNQQHIVTSSALSAEERSASASGARYQWDVYTNAGNKIGSFASAVSFAPFVVVRDTLLYVTPPREHHEGDQVVLDPMSLLAFDLDTGNQAYKVAIRDVRFRGPFPP